MIQNQRNHQNHQNQRNQRNQRHHQNQQNHRAKRGAGLFFTLLFCVWPLLAEGLEHQDYTLDNGLRVIMVKESKAAVVLSQVWYRIGATDEQEGKTGLAHMLEHMMFQGTKKVAAGEFSRTIARNGGEDNASTAHDFTNYYIKLASDRIDLALRLEADRMRHLQLTEEAFQSENLVVQEERRTRTDANPKRQFMEKLRKIAYRNQQGQLHPYGRPVIGLMKDVQQLTLADLQAWYQHYYAPNNAILVIVGDIDFAEVRKLVQQHFAALPALPELFQDSDGKRPPLPEFQPQAEPVQARFEVQDDRVSLPIWYGGYPVPSLATVGKEDIYALDVLSTILGGGSSSRLYQKLVKKEGLAVSASSGYGGYGRGWELFSLSATPKLEQHKPDKTKTAALFKQIEQAMLHEVARMASEPVSKRELQRAKNSMIASHVYAQSSTHTIASYIGMLSVNEMDWLNIIASYPDKIKAITTTDIQRVAARYLTAKKILIGVLQP